MRIYGEEKELAFRTVLADVVVVNMISLVLITVIFGLPLNKVSSTGTMTHFFRVVFIVWPWAILKMALFSVVSDTVALTLWYRVRYREVHSFEVASKAALMNLPALILSFMVWIFVTIMNLFFEFIRVV